MIKVNTVDDFFEKGTFLVAEDKQDAEPPFRYMHDNFRDFKQRLNEIKKEHGEVYGYTLVDGEDNTLILVEGFRWVNRVGYFITMEDISFTEEELIY